MIEYSRAPNRLMAALANDLGHHERQKRKLEKRAKLLASLPEGAFKFKEQTLLECDMRRYRESARVLAGVVRRTMTGGGENR